MKSSWKQLLLLQELYTTILGLANIELCTSVPKDALAQILEFREKF